MCVCASTWTCIVVGVSFLCVCVCMFICATHSLFSVRTLTTITSHGLIISFKNNLLSSDVVKNKLLIELIVKSHFLLSS